MHANKKVDLYLHTVSEFTNKISRLRNRLGGIGIKDERIIVPPTLGAERKISGNLLAGDQFSMSFALTSQETLRIVYSNGNEKSPGGFFPEGADGWIARSYLHNI
ncbi:hypothetical protein AMTR_s00016p00253670 [Amborella trichopoda]|uniref:Uncharacterized protein n=1 Tax=Amborella trichopoda TaxID=13333 RepID=W1PEM1_AMBTC|nr:hypothetical protein AMTR_s00016p00253670 [Amborella trichopoda]